MISVAGLYSFTTCAFMACADAVDRNHKLIVCAEKAAGANFVVIDNPAGDKQTSPIGSSLIKS